MEIHLLGEHKTTRIREWGGLYFTPIQPNYPHPVSPFLFSRYRTAQNAIAREMRSTHAVKVEETEKRTTTLQLQKTRLFRLGQLLEEPLRAAAHGVKVQRLGRNRRQGSDRVLVIRGREEVQRLRRVYSKLESQRLREGRSGCSRIEHTRSDSQTSVLRLTLASTRYRIEHNAGTLFSSFAKVQGCWSLKSRFIFTSR